MIYLPLAEQERIMKRGEQLLSLCDVMEARLQSADAKRERGRLVAAVMRLSVTQILLFHSEIMKGISAHASSGQ